MKVSEMIRVKTTDFVHMDTGDVPPSPRFPYLIETNQLCETWALFVFVQACPGLSTPPWTLETIAMAVFRGFCPGVQAKTHLSRTRESVCALFLLINFNSRAISKKLPGHLDKNPERQEQSAFRVSRGGWTDLDIPGHARRDNK